MPLHEVVLCATTSSAPSTGAGAIYLHDIQTGTSLASFKQTNAGAHCTDFVQSNNVQGGFMLAAQSDKSILNVYNFQKDQLAMKMVLPERLSCIAVDARGNFCAGGTAHGRIYLWEVASGIMYNAWDAHYRQITVLRFTRDGAALLSGSDDSGVNVWSVSRLCDDGCQNDLAVPHCSLSDHTLPITDIICGAGSFPRCRVLTSSLDHSVKLWDLSTRSHPLLTTFQFPKPITCLAWDLCERFFFAASSDDEGSVHRMNLFRQRENGLVAEAVGGAGVGDVVRVGFDSQVEKTQEKKRLMLAGSLVTCLAISMASSLLLVGTSAGSIRIFDIASHQLLRSILVHKDKGLRISTLATILKPLDLVGHINLNLSADAKDGPPIHPKPVVPFMKMRDAKAREKREVWMMEGDGDDADTASLSHSSASLAESILREQAAFLQPNRGASTAPSDAALAPSVESLQSEIASLRTQLGKAKVLNDAMWERVVHKVVLMDRPDEE